MSINRVKTTGGEQSFNFLTNQSSILHTVDTNKITINGVENGNELVFTASSRAGFVEKLKAWFLAHNNN